MISPVRSELLLLVQASIGWAVLAVRAANGLPRKKADGNDVAPATETPIRLRATITIDIDATDPSGVARERLAIERQFLALGARFPHASLVFRRRKPRTGSRPSAPKIVVTPYADD